MFQISYPAERNGHPMIIQICVGSSCHIKGSHRIVELMNKAIDDYGLQDEIILTGSFCIGRCNPIGVTIQIDDDIHSGITPENFKDFFTANVLSVIQNERI
jgi:NADH:ubiquinone oxidoreductase subunit E